MNFVTNTSPLEGRSEIDTPLYIPEVHDAPYH